MKLTPFGRKALVFYLTMVGAFYAAPYVNLFFLLLAFLTLQWCVGAVATRRNLAGVTVDCEHVEPVPSETPAAISAQVRLTHKARGARPRSRFQIRVVLQLSHGEEVAGTLDHLERDASLALTVPPLARGVYAVESAHAMSSYPFELVTARRAIEAPTELIVYPAPSEVGEARSAADALADLLGKSDPGQGNLQPAGLRDWKEGDEPRSIHWRASARRAQPVVQEWEGGGGEGLEVLLDRRCDEEELEEALSAISALVAAARSNKEVLALHTQGLQATFGEGHAPWKDALRFLAGADALPKDAAAPPPVSPSVARFPRRRAVA